MRHRVMLHRVVIDPALAAPAYRPTVNKPNHKGRETDMSFIETTYRDQTYTVPEAGRGASNAMLAEIPSDDYALAFLMQNGDLSERPVTRSRR